MKRIFKGIAALLLVVLAIMVARTLMIAAPSEQAAAPPIPVDSNIVAQHLAQAVRFQTISYGDGIKENEKTMALEAMHGWMERSEEHTSELQSPDHLVCRLLLEKKKKQIEN